MKNIDMICSMMLEKIPNMTNLQLQKLLYFIQAYSLVYKNKKAFSTKMEAWMYGPVVPEVYRHFKNNKEYYKFPYNDLDEDIKESVSLVVDNLGKCNPYLLVEVTHGYEPWEEAWENNNENYEITSESIQNYHSNKLSNEGSAF